MGAMLGTVGLLAHAIAAAVFLALAVALAARARPDATTISVAVASLVTSAWALFAVAVAHEAETPIADLALRPMETLRTAAWIVVLLILVRRSLKLETRRGPSFLVGLGLGFLLSMMLVLDVLTPPGVGGTAHTFHVACRMVIAIGGLVLLHNIYASSLDHEGPSVRFLAVGLAVLFAYDLNLHTVEFLMGFPNPAFVNVRGAVDAMAAPLLYLALRSPDGRRFQLSREVAFNTISFSVIGAYLIFMSLVAYGLRLTGGDWGALLQVSFLAATVIGGLLVILSPRFRARMRVKIARNFYRYRYDYRVEWLRFIDTIDGESDDEAAAHGPIRERLIRSVATVMHAPGGALLEPAEAGGYELTARWNWHGPEVLRLGAGSALEGKMAEGRILVLEEERGRAQAERRPLPSWAEDEELWLAVPLVRRHSLTAFLLLRRSLAPRELNWEDFDLLRTLGRQGASYLAESATQAALDEARAFDEFNRRFAFVMHDLKNLVSQVGLLARNAERHADNAEFRRDMVATLNASAAKMTDLLALLGRERREEPMPLAQPREIDLAAVVRVVAADARRRCPTLDVDEPGVAVPVAGDGARLEAMLAHLVDNAIEASEPGRRVALILRRDGRHAVLEVVDEGEGMAPAFVRDELFRPFRSTKADGFGIGAFEAREIVRAHGGRIQVESRPGEGSRFLVQLPLLHPERQMA